MALYATCSNKHQAWTWNDLMRVIIAKTFTANGAGSAFGNGLRTMHVADSGEDYYCAGRVYEDLDQLARKLVGVDGDGYPALRVCFGTALGNVMDCNDHNIQDRELLLTIIGKASDGEPMVRIACANLP